MSLRVIEQRFFESGITRRAGGAARAMARAMIPEEMVVPVLSGPAKGMRWVVGSAPNGAWTGHLERYKLKRFAGKLHPGMTVWDIGANVGLYTLPSSRAVGPSGKVWAFEPLPRNLHYLNQHLVMNQVTNSTVVACAVSDRDGFVRMSEGPSPSEFHVDPGGSWELPVISLSAWSSRTNSPPPDVVKIDVEGEEISVLRGAAEVFSRHRPVIFLALHGAFQREECRKILEAWDFRIGSAEPGVSPENGSEWIAEPGE